MSARGWVLAGGASSRFGRNKALAQVDGREMVLRVADALSALGLRVGIVARSHELGALGLPVLVEPDGPLHPLWGVAAALRLGDGVFAPCDVPWLGEAELSGLLGAPPRVGWDGQRIHPLVAHYPAEWADEAARLARAGRSAREFAQGAERVEIPASALRNVNTPDALD